MPKGNLKKKTLVERLGAEDPETGEQLRRAAEERVAELRRALAEGSDLLGEAAEQGRRWAKETGVPALDTWRKRAAQYLEDLDTDQLRSDVAAASKDVGDQLVRMGTDIADASRHEADRVIGAIHQSAEEARRETLEAERRQRVKALIGWTAFGFVAGVLLGRQLASSDVEPEPPLPRPEQVAEEQREEEGDQPTDGPTAQPMPR